MGSSRSRSRKKKSTPIAGEETKRVHKKYPGFDAFFKSRVSGAKEGKKERKGRKRRMVICEEVEEPVEGVHSLEWAQAIVPQPNSGFLKLPYEVRLNIYRHAIDDFVFKDDVRVIEPMKKKQKFRCRSWKTPAADTERLYMICRQSYVDVVGSGLLYQVLPFSFKSPDLMLNYLLVIHPVHRDAIQTIKNVTFPITPKLGQPSSLALSTLASLPNLQSLGLTFSINHTLYNKRPSQNNWRRYDYSLKQEVLDGLIACEGLIGNGKKDNDGGEGGIRGLQSLNVELKWSPTAYQLRSWEGEHARYQGVVDGLKAVMVRSR